MEKSLPPKSARYVRIISYIWKYQSCGYLLSVPCTFTLQLDVDESRPVVLSEIILSPINELQYVKDALLESTEEKEGVDQHQKLKDALRESTEEKEKLD